MDKSWRCQSGLEHGRGLRSVGQLTNDQVVGIILIVLGALLFLGFLGTVLLALVAVGLIVVGILILMRNLRGPAWLGATCLVIGALLVLPTWGPVQDVVKGFIGILITVAAIILIVLGVMKLIQRP